MLFLRPVLSYIPRVGFKTLPTISLVNSNILRPSNTVRNQLDNVSFASSTLIYPEGGIQNVADYVARK